MQFFQQINVKSIRHWDSNSKPLGHDSPPITTKPGLDQICLLVICNMTRTTTLLCLNKVYLLYLLISKKNIASGCQLYRGTKWVWGMKRFFNRTIPVSLSLLSSFHYSLQMFYIKVRRWLVSNRGPVVSEATSLPTGPQPLPEEWRVWELIILDTKEFYSIDLESYTLQSWVSIDNFSISSKESGD